MYQITNITLNNERFTVYALIDGIEESYTFLPEVTAKEIIEWCENRVAYHKELKEKLVDLKEELGV